MVRSEWFGWYSPLTTHHSLISPNGRGLGAGVGGGNSRLDHHHALGAYARGLGIRGGDPRGDADGHDEDGRDESHDHDLEMGGAVGGGERVIHGDPPISPIGRRDREKGSNALSVPTGSSLRAERSNPGRSALSLDCFVALRAPRNDSIARLT